MNEFLQQPMFEVGQITVNGLTLLVAIAILLMTILVARLVRKALERFIGLGRSPLQRANLRVAIRLIQYAVVVLGFLVALHTLGIRFTALFAAGAVFAVALGFAMQNVIANFVSGVILLLERSIKPGDILKVGDEVIEVREMGIRAAIGRTLDEEDLIVPSSQLVQSTVKNYTLRDSINRLRVLVGVTYGSDMRLVRQTLEATAAAFEWRAPGRDPVVLMKNFGSSSVDFEVSVWFDDPWSRQRRSSDMHEGIWWALKDAGITIAFPQLDVHFDADAFSGPDRSPRIDRNEDSV